jgi:hypothetical protein
MCEVRSRALQLSSVAKEQQSDVEKSGDLVGQAMLPEPGTMRQGCMALIQLLCVMWHRLAETRAHVSRRQHPLLTSLALVDTVVRSGHCALDCTVCFGNHLYA